MFIDNLSISPEPSPFLLCTRGEADCLHFCVLRSNKTNFKFLFCLFAVLSGGCKGWAIFSPKISKGILCIFPAYLCRSLRELHLICKSTKVDLSPALILTDWWCGVICWPLARTCINWICVAVEDRRAVLQSVPRGFSWESSSCSDVIYRQAAKAHLLLQRAENTRVQKFCGRIKSCRGSCKGLRFSF